MSLLPNVWDWFANNAVPWLGQLLWDFLKSIVKLLAPWLLSSIRTLAAIWAFLEIMYWAASIVGDGINEIILSGIAKPDSSILVYGSFINRFVPLVEIFAMTVLVWQVYVLVIVIRWAKSLIPMWSN